MKVLPCTGCSPGGRQVEVAVQTWQGVGCIYRLAPDVLDMTDILEPCREDLPVDASQTVPKAAPLNNMAEATRSLCLCGSDSGGSAEQNGGVVGGGGGGEGGGKEEGAAEEQGKGRGGGRGGSGRSQRGRGSAGPGGSGGEWWREEGRTPGQGAAAIGPDEEKSRRTAEDDSVPAGPE